MYPTDDTTDGALGGFGSCLIIHSRELPPTALLNTAARTHVTAELKLENPSLGHAVLSWQPQVAGADRTGQRGPGTCPSLYQAPVDRAPPGQDVGPPDSSG